MRTVRTGTHAREIVTGPKSGKNKPDERLTKRGTKQGSEWEKGGTKVLDRSGSR